MDKIAEEKSATKPRQLTDNLLKQKNRYRSGLGFKHTSTNLEMKKKTINDAVIKKKIVDEVKLVKSQDRGDKKDQINQEQVQKTVDENIAKSDQSSSMERKISRIKKGKSGAKKYKNELGLML